MLCTFGFLCTLVDNLVWGGNEISGLKLATDLRLKRVYHCRITDVGEDDDLRIIIRKSIGG